MDREYRVLENGTAVLMTRQPMLEVEKIKITFTGAPEGVTAIFENGSNTIYRALENNVCTIPVDILSGPVSVTLAILDKSARPKKWICEELLADKWKNGAVLISPNDSNLPMRVLELKLENEKIRKNQERLEERLDKLSARLDDLYEGYDLV